MTNTKKSETLDKRNGYPYVSDTVTQQPFLSSSFTQKGRYSRFLGE